MAARTWLDGIDIATPCSADWNDMQGDDRRRFCSLCNLHVFDLSAMPRADAEALVRERLAQPGQRLCVRFRRRADGTVLTQDCPVGLRGRLRRAAAGVAAACAALLACVGCRRPQPAPKPPPTTSPASEQLLMGDAVQPPVEVPTPRTPPAPPIEMGKVKVPDAPQ